MACVVTAARWRVATGGAVWRVATCVASVWRVATVGAVYRGVAVWRAVAAGRGGSR